MTNNQEGLARILTSDGPVVAWYTQGAPSADVALVDGREYSDLPDLLAAAQSTGARITHSRSLPVDPASDLLAPVERPRKIICVGQNYLAHVKEGGRASGPQHPDLFAKWDNAISAPQADIPLPIESAETDFESELTVVIGKRCRRVAAADVADVVFGYTAANDGSVRDFQFHTAQRTAGKAWDALTPLGPVVVPADKLGGTQPALRIQGRLNGETMQDSFTDRLIFPVPELIAYISTFMTLEPGDLILTGTPEGVGGVRDPQVFLHDGDVFEVEIEGIGTLRNRYVSGVSPS